MSYKGYQDKEKRKEYLKDYMREHRKREREHKQLLTDFVIESERSRRWTLEMVMYIREIGEILRQPCLSDKEIVDQILAIEIGKGIADLLQPKRVLTKSELKK